jgi:hypothetical protein
VSDKYVDHEVRGKHLKLTLWERDIVSDKHVDHEVRGNDIEVAVHEYVDHEARESEYY